ncbi:RNAse P Rpr2/Rpp21/SNM1 subunit domain-containing protein [Lentinula aff. detonsa]|nr:RNAse P Rpr2/Rpp21/SNM1 subunit domain-containing protein [Lentinula aff. detonsa]
MGKKLKNDIPNPSSVSNRDVIQRLNFLYQASVYLNNVHSSSTSPLQIPISSNANDSTSGVKKSQKRKKSVNLNDLSRTYIETMQAVGSRTTVQLDPSVKRTLCKGCNIVLVPGSTTSVRTKKSSTHGHIMVYTCTTCKYSYRIPAVPIIRPNEAFAASELGTAVMDVDVPQAQTDIQSSSQVDVFQGQQQQTENYNQTRKKKRRSPRLPPLFARDAGHVVFAGNEQLPTSNGSWNDGVFIT